MGFKFEVGEVAIARAEHKAVLIYGGGDIEVEVVERGPYAPEYCCPIRAIRNRYQSDYIIQAPDGRFWFAYEHQLRKRPGPEDFKKSLEPCENQFRDGQLQRWLNPAKSPTKELETRMQRVFPSLEEIERLQPFDGFYEGAP